MRLIPLAGNAQCGATSTKWGGVYRTQFEATTLTRQQQFEKVTLVRSDGNSLAAKYGSAANIVYDYTYDDRRQLTSQNISCNGRGGLAFGNSPKKGGVNLYHIVGNDPVNRWDYLGMCGGEGEPPCELPPFIVTDSSAGPSRINGMSDEMWREMIMEALRQKGPLFGGTPGVGGPTSETKESAKEPDEDDEGDGGMSIEELRAFCDGLARSIAALQDQLRMSGKQIEAAGLQLESAKTSKLPVYDQGWGRDAFEVAFPILTAVSGGEAYNGFVAAGSFLWSSGSGAYDIGSGDGSGWLSLGSGVSGLLLYGASASGAISVEMQKNSNPVIAVAAVGAFVARRASPYVFAWIEERRVQRKWEVRLNDAISQYIDLARAVVPLIDFYESEWKRAGCDSL